MSDSDLKPPAGAVLFSEKLLGLRAECSVCGEWENSTGWLVYSEADGFRWYVHLSCTGCRSSGGTWRRDWLPLIEELLTTQTRPCAACSGKGRCSACTGMGVDVGVAVMGGSEIDCERCHGSAACSLCGGSGKVSRGAS